METSLKMIFIFVFVFNLSLNFSVQYMLTHNQLFVYGSNSAIYNKRVLIRNVFPMNSAL